MIVVGKIRIFFSFVILVGRCGELMTPYTLMTAKGVQSYTPDSEFKQF